MVRARVAVLLAAAVAPAVAFWRMECRGVGGNYRIDPLVSPGEASSHLHAIMGSGAFNENANYDSIKAGDCTSCLVTEDKSSYWHPTLHFLDAETGEFELVEQVGGMLAYYLLYYGNGNTNITAFPENFRMIAGDNSRKSFTAGNVLMADPPKSLWASLNQTTQDHLSQRAIGFNCLDYSKSPESSLYRHFLPNKAFLDANCPDGIRFELMFPSCWNGKDTDSTNHRDHVAYPDLVMTGDCPDDYPVRLPSLFYETIWNTPAYADRNGHFVISNGDVQGFAYHGDFMTGWDVNFLQNAVDTCTNPSGLISDCPLFTIQSLADADSCKLNPPAVVAGDNVNGPASSLPGDVALFGSYLDATMIANYDPALSAQPATTAFDGSPGGYAAPSVALAPVAAETTTSSIAVLTTTSSTPIPTTTAVAAAADAPAAVPAVSVEPAVFATVRASSSSTSSSTATTAPPSTTSTTPTPAPPPSTTPAAAPTTTAKIVSTQYITQGNMVKEVLWEETTVYVTENEDVVSTVTVVATATAPARRNVHRHNHMEQHAQKHRRRGRGLVR